jgi:hypothetical protein
VSSERKIAANRINGRKSRGPRTAAGKARASRNSLRHGLSTIRHLNPAVSGKIEQMAKAICGDDQDPLLFDQAIIIAENDILLRSIGAERIAAIERLRDPTAIALAEGDNSIASAKARVHEGDLAWAELERMNAQFGITGVYFDPRPVETMAMLENLPPQPGWMPKPVQERDEVDAMREAMPDLVRLARYERRAWSRRKRAMLEFIKIKSTAPRADRAYSGTL